MARPISYCKVENCDDRVVGFGRCNRHYRQFKRHGETFTTIYENRPAVIDGSIAKIPLGVNAKDGYAIVDKEFSYLDQYNWQLSHGYVVSHNRKERRILHRLITECPDHMVVDHVNHDTLDNRRDNLRICTHAENLRNMKLPSDNKSGYKGVFWDTNKGKWHAKLNHNSKSIYLGYFANKIDGAKAYNEKASEIYGQFANLNIIKEKT